ncbi:unnamed protein product [Cuscuta campestris]|uniref:F-box domain-containing protein n=1 Tax=Cuscuta campestris TaxID=132261 RepID=A0A484KY20_9ASTE|nr:unnamed protein product [Cuscuta campestris]
MQLPLKTAKDIECIEKGGRVVQDVYSTVGGHISQLPDEMLEIILYKLTLRDAVRTSLVSSRWRHLVLTRACLIFDLSNMFGIESPSRFVVVEEIMNHPPKFGGRGGGRDDQVGDFIGHRRENPALKQNIELKPFVVIGGRGNLRAGEKPVEIEPSNKEQEEAAPFFVIWLRKTQLYGDVKLDVGYSRERQMGYMPESIATFSNLWSLMLALDHQAGDIMCKIIQLLKSCPRLYTLRIVLSTGVDKEHKKLESIVYRHERLTCFEILGTEYQIESCKYLLKLVLARRR